MYQDGQGFVPDALTPGAPVFVLGQNPGKHEEQKGQPFVGRTGEEMMETYFPLAGLQRGENVSIGNTLKCRWQASDELPPAKVLREAVVHCTREHLRIPPETKLVVAQGAVAWDALGGGDLGSITDWRGFLHPSLWASRSKVFATLHLAALAREPRMRLPTQADWLKVPKILAGEWPLPLPPYYVASAADEGVVDYPGLEWLDAALAAEFVVLDTEYHRESKYLFLIGLRAHFAPGTHITYKTEPPSYTASLLFDWRTDHPKWFRAKYLTALRHLVQRVPVVFQNYLADGPVLAKNIGLEYGDFKQIEDTMQAHAVLESEWPHDLGFLASLYGKYDKLKHLAGSDLYLYNHGDLLATEDSWLALCADLGRDLAVRRIYREQNLALLPIIHRRGQAGIHVDQGRVTRSLQEYEERLQAARQLAQAAQGYPFNPGSPAQVQAYCQAQGWKFPKKKAGVGADVIAGFRNQREPVPDVEAEERDGLTPEQVLVRVEAGADPILEARVLYAGAAQALGHFIKPLLIKDGVRERIYPDQKIHAQASGRWSTTVFT